MASPMPELHNKSIMELNNYVEKCIRIMSIEMDQLRVEARERDIFAVCPIIDAAQNNYPLRCIKRLQLAYPAGVNAKNKWGTTALMAAAFEHNDELVDLLCEMGSCMGYRDTSGDNAFDAINAPDDDEDDSEDEFLEREKAKAAPILAILEKHGVTSNVINETFTSPLYYESIYYTKRVNDTNWAQYGTILMCMEEIDVKYRKRGEKALSHLSKDAKCFFRVFTCVDGTDGLGNGIARWILTFIGGENTRERLKGVPLDPKF
jgi:hypothetical protein